MDDLPERINVSALSETDRQEVENFLKGTNQQLSVNKIVANLTKTCWEKCITSPITQGALTSREQSCASNCVARWLESQSSVVKALSEAELRKR
ncbi:MAG: Mitochondrial import inner membrane translocase subunit tim8 [Stictis urceolatum]|nr:Mitochondrial import inner membrane translocase subunit tim8 [Stictis urceolata]